MANEIASGIITGTGANIDIKCGFIPAKVEIYNWVSSFRQYSMLATGS